MQEIKKKNLKIIFFIFFLKNFIHWQEVSIATQNLPQPSAEGEYAPHVIIININSKHHSPWTKNSNLKFATACRLPNSSRTRRLLSTSFLTAKRTANCSLLAEVLRLATSHPASLHMLRMKTSASTTSRMPRFANLAARTGYPV